MSEKEREDAATMRQWLHPPVHTLRPASLGRPKIRHGRDDGYTTRETDETHMVACARHGWQGVRQRKTSGS